MFYIQFNKDTKKVTQIMGGQGDIKLPKGYNVPEGEDTAVIPDDLYYRLETDFFQKDVVIKDITKTTYEEAFELTDKTVEEVTEPPSLEEQVEALRSALASTQELLNNQLGV